MNWDTVKKHALDLAKGFLAAVLVAAASAAVQYVQVHVPDILTLLGQVAAATGTIKITRA